jgi:hypothetical protein
LLESGLSLSSFHQLERSVPQSSTVFVDNFVQNTRFEVGPSRETSVLTL